MPRPLLLIIYTAVAILVLMLSLKYVLPILLPFIIALFLSIFMEPFIRFLQLRLKLNRGFAALSVILVLFGGVAVVFSAIVLQLVAELIQLSASLPIVTSEIIVYYGYFIDRITDFYITLPPGVISSLEPNITNLATNLQGLLSNLANSLLTALSLVPGTYAIMIVVMLATYFLARDRHLISEVMVRIIPAPWGERIITITNDVAAAFVAYIRAQAILILISTVLSVTGLYLIGAEYALSMGLLIGFFDIIPVLGPATVYIPWIIWTFATGATWFGFKLSILYLLVLVVRQVLEPKIISANLGLHPLATIFSMYAGLKTLGLAGLVIGPILLIAIQSVIKAGRWFQ